MLLSLHLPLFSCMNDAHLLTSMVNAYALNQILCCSTAKFILCFFKQIFLLQGITFNLYNATWISLKYEIRLRPKSWLALIEFGIPASSFSYWIISNWAFDLVLKKWRLCNISDDNFTLNDWLGSFWIKSDANPPFNTQFLITVLQMASKGKSPTICFHYQLITWTNAFGHHKPSRSFVLCYYFLLS